MIALISIVFLTIWSISISDNFYIRRNIRYLFSNECLLGGGFIFDAKYTNGSVNVLLSNADTSYNLTEKKK